LNAYLAKLAYQIGDFETSLKAAEKNCLLYCEKSEITEKYLGFSENPVVYLRLIQEKVQDVSLIEAKYLSESFVIWARCQKKLNAEMDDVVQGKMTLLTKQVQKKYF
jgi:hypothetical protein